MLRDRSKPVDLFALVPALELRFEPELAELDQLLEDDQMRFALVNSATPSASTSLACR